MMEFAPEDFFVLYAFESIISGLLVFVLLWAFYRQPGRRDWRRLRLLTAALAAVSVGFFLCAALNFYEFYHQAPLEDLPENIGFFFFLFAPFLLTLAFAGPFEWRLRWGLFWLGPAVLTASSGALVLWKGWPPPLHWLLLASLFAIVILQSRTKIRSRRSCRIFFLAMSGLGVSFLCLYISAASGGSVSMVFGIGKHLTLLAALIALSHLIELETGSLFIKFLIRLNLSFVVLAGLIILTVTRLQRQEFINFSQREASDLIEFLRGHVLYFHNQGETDLGVLGQVEITRRIVSAFGALPDLRKITIRFREAELQMAIGQGGLIDRRLLVENLSERKLVSVPTVDEHSLYLSSPILLADNLAGYVLFEESSATMNRRIAHQILIIFAAFSVVVVFGGVVIGILVTQADHTIQRQYKELEDSHRRLLQSAKLAAVGEMAEGVAHEVNNPLGVVLGRADYLSSLARLKNREEFLEDLEVIQTNAGRAARIIEDLLDFGRPQVLDRRPYDVNELVDETLKHVKPEGSQMQITRKLGTLPAVSMDRDRLRQVLVNLVNNAIDACAKVGQIHIETESSEDGSSVTVSVEDNGQGIPGDALQKIFDPFFTTKKKGTGLGLSLSYGIVRAHGGEIRVRSTRGRGARFTLTLPVNSPSGGDV